MRGINTGGVASTVGIYLDDVPFGSSSGLANAAILSGDIDTFDMARVEVLRGPQGTLYGASALGGVIKYVANAPSTDGFEGRLQGSVEDVAGAGLGYGLTGVVNIPMGDSFAVRASGFYRTTGGYIDSIGTDPIPALQDPERQHRRRDAGRGRHQRQRGRRRPRLRTVHAVGNVLARPVRALPEHQLRQPGFLRGRPGDAAAAGRPARRLALPQRADRHRVPALQRDARLGLRRRLAAVRDELQRVPRGLRARRRHARPDRHGTRNCTAPDFRLQHPGND